VLSRTIWVGLIVAALSLTGAAQMTELQRATALAMKGKRGSAVVIDVVSNRVLASVNLAGAARRVVRPGSAVKPFTLLALLSTGNVAPATAISCRGKFTIAGHTFQCGHPANTGPLDGATALAYSCNDYFTTLAPRLTPVELQQAFLQAGLASPSGLVPQEATGHVELSASREQLQLQAIGTENVLTTPLAMLRAYRDLALLRRGPSDTTHETVYAGLEAGGSLGLGRLAQPTGTFQVAGKTGTARASEGPWTHGWFLGFAPADKPEVALVVFLERGTGPADAAPVAGRIFTAYARQRQH
jgi:cell division protein FtsI/penicillin-binding protein 2